MTHLILITVALGSLDVPLPPPPAGMSLVDSAPTLAQEVVAVANQPAQDARENEAPSADLEELRALENATISETMTAETALRTSLYSLGYASGHRDPLVSALTRAADHGAGPAFELGPVTNLAHIDIETLRGDYDIPIEMQPLVAQYIRFFQGPGRRWFRNWVSRGHRFIPLMQPILESYGLPRDTIYLAMIESGFSTQAYSWAHAAGPWQFIVGTAKAHNLRVDFWADERKDPIKSTHAAARYLKELYAETGHWYLAWAGYNSGGGTVRRMVRKRGTTNFWELSEGRGFAKETKHYVPKLIACAIVAKNLSAFGFSESEFEPWGPLSFDSVQLTDAVDLDVLARAAGTTSAELRDLNPELRRWLTPPASAAQPYTLKLPHGTATTFAANFEAMGPKERLNLRVHRVVRGDTLSRIASSYHSVPEAIMRMNGLASAKSLRVGTELMVPVPSARAIKSGLPDAALERHAAKARKAGVAASRPEDEIPAGGVSPKVSAAQGTVSVSMVQGKKRVTYGVAQGDSLWSISQRFDVTVGDLRAWNTRLSARRGGLRAGTPLIIWPGPKAQQVASN